MIIQAKIQITVVKITNKKDLCNHDQLVNHKMKIFQISSNPKEVLSLLSLFPIH